MCSNVACWSCLVSHNNWWLSFWLMHILLELLFQCVNTLPSSLCTLNCMNATCQFHGCILLLMALAWCCCCLLLLWLVSFIDVGSLILMSKEVGWKHQWQYHEQPSPLILPSPISVQGKRFSLGFSLTYLLPSFLFFYPIHRHLCSLFLSHQYHIFYSCHFDIIVCV
jgi:hypothetical protein